MKYETYFCVIKKIKKENFTEIVVTDKFSVTQD